MKKFFSEAEWMTCYLSHDISILSIYPPFYSSISKVLERSQSLGAKNLSPLRPRRRSEVLATVPAGIQLRINL